MPAARQRSRSPSIAAAVIAMIGAAPAARGPGCAGSRCSRPCAASARPSGSRRSRRRGPPRPRPARRPPWRWCSPGRPAARCATSWLTGLSSTTRIRPLAGSSTGRLVARPPGVAGQQAAAARDPTAVAGQVRRDEVERRVRSVAAACPGSAGQSTSATSYGAAVAEQVAPSAAVATRSDVDAPPRELLGQDRAVPLVVDTRTRRPRGSSRALSSAELLRGAARRYASRTTVNVKMLPPPGFAAKPRCRPSPRRSRSRWPARARCRRGCGWWRRRPA